MNRLVWFIAIVIIFLSTVLAACNDQPKRITNMTETEESITGEITILWDTISAVPSKTFASEPLTKRYPNAKFNLQSFWPPFWTVEGRENELQAIIKKETKADIIMFNSKLMPFLIESGYLEPLDDQLALQRDLIQPSEFQSSSITRIRSYDPEGRLYGLPFGANVYGLFYNKDIFDKNAVPYPTNDMTWDEIISLASQFPRKESLIPLEIVDYHLPVSQLSLSPYDLEMNQADYNTPGWERLVDVLVRVSNFQNREFIEGFKAFTNGRVAMVAGGIFKENPHQFKQIPSFLGMWSAILYLMMNIAQRRQTLNIILAFLGRVNAKRMHTLFFLTYYRNKFKPTK